MRRFAAGETDVLVATTVIEVGVDVPNASMMVICDADRFGISQLHQLRGRIGRGGHPGVCLLLTTADAGTARAGAARRGGGTRDGFALAEVDLEQRREGDVLGASQSGGRSSLRLLRVLRRRRRDRRGTRARRSAVSQPTPSSTDPGSAPTSSPHSSGTAARGLAGADMTRIIAGSHAAAGGSPSRPATRPGRPPTGSARRCSPRSRRGPEPPPVTPTPVWPGWPSPTSTRARGPSAWRRRVAAPATLLLVESSTALRRADPSQRRGTRAERRGRRPERPGRAGRARARRHARTTSCSSTRPMRCRPTT